MKVSGRSLKKKPKRKALRTTAGLRKRIKINWTSNLRPHPSQQEIIDSIKPLHWTVVSAGRRGGKTAIAKEIFCRRTTAAQRGVYWWCAPTFERSQKAYEEMKHILNPVVEKKSDSRYTLLLKNGVLLEFKSLKEWENLRGEGLAGCIIDEAARVSRGAWEQLLLPALLDNNGWALLISTPNGRNWFYSEYSNKQNSRFHWTTLDNPYLNEAAREKLLALKATLPDNIYRQEILAEFVEDSGGVFKGLSKCVATRAHNPLNNNARLSPIYCGGIDLGRVNDFTVVHIWRLDTRNQFSKPELAYVERFTDLEWAIQKEKILEIMQEYPGEYEIDSTWNDAIYEELTTYAPPGCSIFPVHLSAPVKTKLIKQAQVEISTGRVEMPEESSDPEIDAAIKVWWEEHRAYEYQVTGHGNIRYAAPEGEHDDTVISSCLALDVALRYANRDSSFDPKPYLAEAKAAKKKVQRPNHSDRELYQQLMGQYYELPEASYFGGSQTSYFGGF